MILSHILFTLATYYSIVESTRVCEQRTVQFTNDTKLENILVCRDDKTDPANLMTYAWIGLFGVTFCFILTTSCTVFAFFVVVASKRDLNMSSRTAREKSSGSSLLSKPRSPMVLNIVTPERKSNGSDGSNGIQVLHKLDSDEDLKPKGKSSYSAGNMSMTGIMETNPEDHVMQLFKNDTPDTEPPKPGAKKKQSRYLSPSPDSIEEERRSKMQ
ncbi:hypothetical protein HDE_01629 [Halotydeus destructor]|nr:hypothetical protein HDE_01629 [Halotydeus destructor]